MPHLTSKSWKADELEQFERMLNNGASPLRLAAKFKRSVVAIRQRARLMGKTFPRKPRFSFKKSGGA